MNNRHKLIRAMDRILEVISMILLACIIVAAVLQVFTRKVLGNSMVGTEEFARYCFIWMSCLGASLCLSNGSHASVNVLKDRLKGRMIHIHGIFSNLIVLFLCYVMIRYGFALLGNVARQSSPTMGLPMNYVYGALPVASVCMALSAIVKLIDEILALKKTKKEKEK